MSKQYRKTALVEAEQFLPPNQIPEGCYQKGTIGDVAHGHGEWFLKTLEGEHPLRHGDYICIGAQGERWNVERAIFESTYELASPAMTTPTLNREAIARIIDPGAFRAWQSLYDYCIRQGDGEPTAKSYADATHLAEIEDALARADAILAFRPAPAPDVESARITLFLEILAAMGGQSDASESAYAWINAFCETHEGRDPDTFNRAIELGYTRSTHDSDTDHSVVYLTEKGREALTAAPSVQGDDGVVAALERIRSGRSSVTECATIARAALAQRKGGGS